MGLVGPKAAAAVPRLIALLGEPDVALRLGVCFGLKGIGPAAKAALPALRQASSDDPDKDVRKFAAFAIDSIERADPDRFEPVGLSPSQDTAVHLGQRYGHVD